MPVAEGRTSSYLIGTAMQPPHSPAVTQDPLPFPLNRHVFSFGRRARSSLFSFSVLFSLLFLFALPSPPSQPPLSKQRSNCSDAFLMVGPNARRRRCGRICRLLRHQTERMTTTGFRCRACLTSSPRSTPQPLLFTEANRLCCPVSSSRRARGAAAGLLGGKREGWT
jgi:hypothetical protein